MRFRFDEVRTDHVIIPLGALLCDSKTANKGRQGSAAWFSVSLGLPLGIGMAVLVAPDNFVAGDDRCGPVNRTRDAPAQGKLGGAD